MSCQSRKSFHKTDSSLTTKEHMPEIDLSALVGEADRTILVAGLQALHRERRAAWNSAVSVAILRGKPQPARELFGLDEASEMLRRVGAAPSSF